MTTVEKIARHVCTRMGYEPELEVSVYPGISMPIGPMGHQCIPELRLRAWELYARVVREVLTQLRDVNGVRHAIENEHTDPASTPESLWRAGVDALLVEEVVPFACDREDVNYGLVGEADVIPAKGWRKLKGLE